MKRYFNIEYAVLAFVTMSVPIFVLNLLGGTPFQALGAGLAQGLLSFTIAGFNTAFFEFVQHRFHNLWAVIVPALVNSLLSLVVHIINGSPQPVYTAAFVFFTAAWHFSVLTYFREVHTTISIRHLSGKLVRHIAAGKTRDY